MFEKSEVSACETTDRKEMNNNVGTSLIFSNFRIQPSAWCHSDRMPRIDPSQLLRTLSVLLSPAGGIKSADEVRIYSTI